MKYLFAISILVCVAYAADYDRREYDTWIDADGDCQDTRAEVLIRQSEKPVTLSSDGCKVLKGEWWCPYTDQIFTDPAKLDIDHFVPLYEAHISGASSWWQMEKREYANCLEHPYTLIAVSSSANRAKGKKDPAQWLPPNKKWHCEYMRRWVAVKNFFWLTADIEEARFLAANLCAE